MKDRFFIRAKDIILIAGAIGGMIVGLGKVYRQPIEMIDAVQSMTVRMEKMEPLVNELMSQSMIKETELKDIIHRLDRMERKQDFDRR